MSIRVPKTGTGSVPKTGTPRHARVPEKVLHDVNLSPAARLVYAELALWVFQGTTAKIGMRQVAKNLGLSKTTVAAAIADLVASGHVQQSGKEYKRSTYSLVSEVFGQKQHAGVTEVVSAPRGSKRYVSVGPEKIYA